MKAAGTGTILSREEMVQMIMNVLQTATLQEVLQIWKSVMAIRVRLNMRADCEPETTTVQ